MDTIKRHQPTLEALALMRFETEMLDQITIWGCKIRTV